MARRKTPLSPICFDVANTKQSFGEIVAQMVEELFREGLTTQNALCLIDQTARRDEIVRRVDEAFSEQVAYAARQANSGASQKKDKSETANRVNTRKCVEALKAQGRKVTRKTVSQIWVELKLGQPPTDKTIGKHLKGLRP